MKGEGSNKTWSVCWSGNIWDVATFSNSRPISDCPSFQMTDKKKKSLKQKQKIETVAGFVLLRFQGSVLATAMVGGVCQHLMSTVF